MKAALGTLLIALLLEGCGGDTADHAGHGVVVSVDAAKGEITLDHEDIPGLMKGMTMMFEAADHALLAGVEVGQEVDFRVREEAPGRYVVTAIEARRR